MLPEGLFLLDDRLFIAGVVFMAARARLPARLGLECDLGLALGPEDGLAFAFAPLFIGGTLLLGKGLPPDAGRFLGDIASKLGVQPQ